MRLKEGQEELSIKASLVMEDEIRYIDNNMETIVDTITKQIISDKDLAIAQHIIQKLQQECEANKKRIEELEEENKIYRRQLNSAFDRGFIHKDKIKEIVDECIPVGKNIITGEEEYQPNANANSYLTQTILELLKDGGEYDYK